MSDDALRAAANQARADQVKATIAGHPDAERIEAETTAALGQWIDLLLECGADREWIVRILTTFARGYFAQLEPEPPDE